MKRKPILVLPAVCLMMTGCGSKSEAPPAAATPAPAVVEKAPAPAGFEKTLELQGIKFTVTCANASSLNKLTITPAGLEIYNAPITREVDGTVTGAEVADLNVDGSPEIYVYVQSAGSGSYGQVVAYSANRKKSLSEITVPKVADNPKAAAGYMGHDDFAVVENTLVQRFPLYEQGDTNAKPTGKTRQLQYKLAAGEAGWKLRVDRIVEY
jgi:hypothetical protein